MLAVLIEGGGADAVQLAAREGGLEQVGRVHGAVAFPRANQGVHFVDEEDDLALGGRDLVQHGLEAFLELAPVFGAGDQGAHVERQDLLVLERFRHVAVDDAERQTLDDGGLADAGLADQDGVVLGAAGEDLDGAADLFVAADDGIDLAIAGGLGQVAGVAFQGVIGVFGAGAVGGLALAQFGDGGLELVRGDAHRAEHGRGHAAVLGDGAEQALGRDELIAGLLGRRFCRGEDAGGVAIQVQLARSARDLGALRQGRFDGALGLGGIAACGRDQIAGEAVALLQQHLEQVFGRELLMPAGQRQRLGGLDGGFGAVGVEVEVHLWSSPGSGRSGPVPSMQATRQPAGPDMGVADPQRKRRMAGTHRQAMQEAGAPPPCPCCPCSSRP